MTEIHAAVAAAAASRPDKAALLARRGGAWFQLSYRQLTEGARAGAWALRQAGVAPGDRVALYCENCPEWAVAYLALMEAGATAVPLDQQLQPSEVAELIKASGARALLASPEKRAALPDAFVGELLAGGRPLLDAAGALRPFPGCVTQAGPQDATADGDPALASIIFTSGTTGRPKGVMLTHDSFLFEARAIVAALAVTDQDQALSLLPLHHAGEFVCGLLTPLLAGATVTYAPELRLDVLLATMRESGTTMMIAVPRLLELFHAVVRGKDADEAQRELGGRLRVLFSGGAALRPDVWQELERIGVPVAQGYGLTEAAPGVTLNPLVGRKPGTVGVPLPGVEVRIVAANGDGEGEIAVRGPNVMRGYFRDPAATAQVLRDGWLHTGDLGRFDEDGHLAIVGRSKEIIVTPGGKNVSPAEVEARYGPIPGVKELAVCGVTTGRHGERVHAAIIIDDAQFPVDVGPQERRRIIERRLAERAIAAGVPDYMWIQRCHFVAELPKTPTLKVKRQELGARLAAAAEDAAPEAAPPRTPLEARLAALWAQVLGVPSLGVHDDFFKLGGDSLLALQLVARLRDEFGVDMTVRGFFLAGTVAGLAEAIASPRTDDAPTDLETDAELDPAVVPAAGGPAAPARLLLTGATGFLGAYLLHELLRQTAAEVYCLVRAPDAGAALQRIRSNLTYFGLDSPDLAGRVIPVPGDLARPLLGLSEARFADLAGRVDAIYHNGALVNFLYPYATLRAANVLGTQEVLRLACRGRVKPLHYISTLGIYHSTRYLGSPPIGEHDEPRHSDQLMNGYEESKWVAERLVRAAAARGLPVRIYRPGAVSGHSRTGAWKAVDFVCRMLKSCIQLGSAPDWEMSLDLAPVDFVSQAVVYLSCQPALEDSVFHLNNPRPMPWRRVTDWLRSFGYPLAEETYTDWEARLVRAIAEGADNALYPLLPLFTEKHPGSPQMYAMLPQFRCDNASRGLAGSPIACPPLDDSLLATYFSYFIASGFLDASDKLRPASGSPEPAHRSPR